MRIYREVASVYAMLTPAYKESPVKAAVDVWRYTNSASMGRGESRLLEIANDLFEEFFGDTRTWNKNEGYQHDSSDRAELALNIMCRYEIYTVRVHWQVPELDSIAIGTRRF